MLNGIREIFGSKVGEISAVLREGRIHARVGEREREVMFIVCTGEGELPGRLDQSVREVVQWISVCRGKNEEDGAWVLFVYLKF